MELPRDWTRSLPSGDELLRMIGVQPRHLPSTDELLRIIGLQSRRTPAADIMPSLAVFGAGMLVGAALALLFAPTSGEALRSEIADRAGELVDAASGPEPARPYRS